MKHLLYVSAVSLLLLWSAISHAQPQAPAILKASYVSTNLTPSMIAILRQQIQSDEQFSAMTEKISRFRHYYSLYINTATNESVFVLDSVAKESGVNIAGYVENAWCNQDGHFFCQEVFMRESIEYSGRPEDVIWSLQEEVQFFQEKHCQKAIMERYPYVVAWYTTDIPLSKGPSSFIGLPGLVVSASDFFNTFDLYSLTTDCTFDDFERIAKTVRDIEAKCGQSFSDVLQMKENVIRMMRKN